MSKLLTFAAARKLPADTHLDALDEGGKVIGCARVDALDDAAKWTPKPKRLRVSPVAACALCRADGAAPTGSEVVHEGLPFDPATAVAAAFWCSRDELRRWERNPRNNDGVPTAKVARSIRRFGFVAPIVVWTSRRRIVAGDTRIKAWDRIVGEAERTVDGVIVSGPRFTPRGAPGPGLVPVRFHEFASEAEADAYAIADNRLNEEATWDPALVRVVIEDIQLGDPDGELVGASGLDDDEIKAYLDDAGPSNNGSTGGDPGEGRYQQQYGVIVVCSDEAEQERVYNDLKSRGYNCRVVVT